MRDLLIMLIVLWTTFLSSLSAFASPQEDEDVRQIDSHSTWMAYRPNQVIVKFTEGRPVNFSKSKQHVTSSITSVSRAFEKLKVCQVSPLMPYTGSLSNKSKGISRSYSGAEVEEPDMSNLYLLELSENSQMPINAVVSMLDSLQEVEFAEPNYLVFALSTGDKDKYTKDPMYSQQWSIPAINLPALWEKPRIREKRSVIAILDTGVDITHPDLAANIWTNTIEAEGSAATDDDRNGYADDIHGWDFVNNSPNIRDNNGHGTHCAGIAAAVGGNGIGITGANPDALIMPITVLQSNGAGDIATIIKGIDYAVANGADIISMSFGTYTYSAAQEQALAKAYNKAVLVAAAGNDGRCIGRCNTHRHKVDWAPCFPAAFHFVIGVQASDDNGTLASFTNYDYDGPVFSEYGEEELYNYEISAPGLQILSTFPNGQYKLLTGTSMACPLVAGAVSRLLDAKKYTSKEELMADIIYASRNGILDVDRTYIVDKNTQTPNLALISVNPNDEEGDSDGHFFAGEIISLYPVLRNSWGHAKNIKLTLALAENEDPNIIEILDNDVDFGYELGYYGSSKTKRPIRFKIADDCADNRIINMVIKVSCDGIPEPIFKEFTLSVENGIELNGIISENTTLYPDKKYTINGKLLITVGTKFTVKPGVTLYFSNSARIKNEGIVYAVGTPDSLIVMNGQIIGNRAIYEYVKFTELTSAYDTPRAKSKLFHKTFDPTDTEIIIPDSLTTNNCIFQGVGIMLGGERNICTGGHSWGSSGIYTNYANNTTDAGNWPFLAGDMKKNCFNNIVGNFLSGTRSQQYSIEGKICTMGYYSSLVSEISLPINYYGSANKDVIQTTVFDGNNPYYKNGYATTDFSNCAAKPYSEAHGIVWKIVVNGYDAQDEFNMLPPLGVGLHKFEVYFNRPMDVSVIPSVSMGTKLPYTQTIIDKNGTWSSDSTVYTVYLNATATNIADGLNSISVFNAKDDEHFEIPSEYKRFHVMVQKAGSLSSGFVAEAGLGKVSLKWDKYADEAPDFLGLNLYRYEQNKDGIPQDTIRVNDYPLESTVVDFIDYNVNPGRTYYYYLSEITTDFVNTVLTKTVAVTPLTASLGDSNGSGGVDVADIVSDIAYVTHQDPKPFIFEAADVNKDETIDIFDIVGTINLILSPSVVSQKTESPVRFYTKDDMLFMHNDIPVSGLQFTLSGANVSEFNVSDTFAGFEVTAYSEMNSYRTWMVYSLCGKTINPGEHMIVDLRGSTLSDVRVCGVRGEKLSVDINAITEISPVTTSVEQQVNRVTLLSSSGVRIAGGVSSVDKINEWLSMQKVQRGVYFVCFYDKTGKLINVQKVIVKN